MPRDYHPQAIEQKWQQHWREARLFETTEDGLRPPYYCLEMFAYPSGHAHVGHVRNYLIGDVVARFMRLRGMNVLHPFGWDAFGLPAENAAIQNQMHPKRSTLDNIVYMRGQLQRLGISYAWEREIATCLPAYYRWNQWIFLKMFEQDLAFRKKSMVNWCPSCQTVLANEQVVAGECWRCGTVVTTRELEQWFLRITAYADELLRDLGLLTAWPHRVVTMQRNWIGRSEGARIRFPVAASRSSSVAWAGETVGEIEVFTTRIDTIFGATFVLLSPEHPLVSRFAEQAKDRGAFLRDIEALRAQDRRARLDGTLEKQGFFTGQYALNPFSRERVPIWIANFVLMEYGTGAVMAVPAHDQRDFEFARKYDLPIRVVVQPLNETLRAPGMPEAYVDDEVGRLVNSGEFDGLDPATARTRMTAFASARGFGQAEVTYRLKDWGISRQRYWGTPIPIIHCDRCGLVPVPYDQLPVRLPEVVEFSGRGDSPLAAVSEFVNVSCPKCGGRARRETDTMDTFFDSSWYFYRFCDPRNDAAPFDPEKVRYWTPVSFYCGGIEHAILHLIYSRFFCKVLRDLGLVKHSEPFMRLLSQGMVLKDGAVMSKSKGNVVDPDSMIQEFGADTLRLVVMFAAPPEKEIEWSDSGIEGSFRFLSRVWRIVDEWADRLAGGPSSWDGLGERERALRRKTHDTIRRVTEDIDPRAHLNTAIAAIMELVNELYAFGDEGAGGQDRRRGRSAGVEARPDMRAAVGEALETVVLMLAPFAPHMCEELWEMLGHRDGLAKAAWPTWDPAIARAEEIVVPVQVNGRLRARLRVPADVGDARLRELALDDEKVAPYLAGKTVAHVVVVPRKLVNVVVD